MGQVIEVKNWRRKKHNNPIKYELNELAIDIIEFQDMIEVFVGNIAMFTISHPEYRSNRLLYEVGKFRAVARNIEFLITEIEKKIK